MSYPRRVAIVVLSFALMIVVAVLFVPHASPEASAASKTASTSTTIVEAKAGQKCTGGYAVKLFGNSGKKLDDAHKARIEALRQKYDGVKLDTQVRDMHLRMAKRDPRFLYLMLKSAKLDSATGVKSVEELSKGGCYTQKGRTAYAVLKGALYAATKVDPNSEAGTGWVNTGVGSDGKVFQTAPGISGNRHGTMYVLPNGVIFVVMDRCGNMTTPGPMKGVPSEKPPTVGHKPPPGTTPVTKPRGHGKDPSKGIGNDPDAAGQGDTGHRAGGPEPSSPPVENPPPATIGTPGGGSTTTLPPPVTGVTQPPVTSPVTSPPTAPA